MSTQKSATRELIPDGAEERFVDVNGHGVRYLTGGSGPPLLLVPGLLGFSFSWSENLAVLSKHFTVFAPDMLNTGYSDRADVPADLRSSAEQLRDFMVSVGLDQADVIASSYGGTMAMALAAIAPQRVRELILVSPCHCASENYRWQVTVFSTAIGGLAAPLMQYAPDTVDGWFIKRMYGDPQRMLPGTVEEYAKPIRNPQTIRWLVEVMRSWKQDFVELKRLMPALRDRHVFLLWGTKDRVVPISTSPALRRELPNSEMTVIETAGHLPYEELPEEFNKIILARLLGRSVPPVARR